MLESNIKQTHIKHGKKRISQGDILQNFEIFSAYSNSRVKMPWVIVLSQDCDLESNFYEQEKIKAIPSNDNTLIKQFLPNILLIPAFIYEKVIDNTYLQTLYKITTTGDWTQKGSEVLRNKLRNNEIDRYHYFGEYTEMPALVIDFKCYFSIPTIELFDQYEAKYFITVNELFRERLSQRFANYLCRIGLPKLDKK